MDDAATLPGILEAGPADSVALLGEQGLQLSYGALRATVESLGGQLVEAGVLRGDRVALTMRNGPAAAIAFLGAARAAIAAPLNPAYPEAEFAFALADLPARLVVTDGTVPAAESAAGSLGIPHLVLDSSFGIGGRSHRAAGLPDPGDVALVLHTSGTTGRPKRVPLTHRNLAVSSRQIAGSLALSPIDRCLNVMPLFHIHGLVGAVLATLASGGSVACTPGFDAFRFFSWVEAFRPTWYTAVPSMHQAVLSRARDHAGAAREAGFRFVRSSSSALPPSVGFAIEELFGAPMIEAYGMTEGSHQICVNPLPPGVRRPGSVGLPTGTEVAILAGGGMTTEYGVKGEVCIRGAAVTPGYEGIDRDEYIADSWLRTGDEGYFADGGALVLSGRLKELVNRGGEKISPREVEEALLLHPAVAEAVAFALPHPSLGEDVGAAVVAAPGSAADAAELRRFAGERLAAFKVPRKIIVVDEIPLGPTGKPQRVGMAERLGLL